MTDEWKHLSEAEYKQMAEKIGEAVMTTQKISDEARELASKLYDDFHALDNDAKPPRTQEAYELRVTEHIQQAIDAAHDKALEDARAAIAKVINEKWQAGVDPQPHHIFDAIDALKVGK